MIKKLQLKHAPGLLLAALSLAVVGGCLWYFLQPKPKIILAIEDVPALRFLETALQDLNVELYFFQGLEVGNTDLVIAEPSKLYALAQNQGIRPLPSALHSQIKESQRILFESEPGQLMAVPFFGYGQALMVADADTNVPKDPAQALFSEGAAVLGTGTRFYTIFPTDQASLAAQMLMTLGGITVEFPEPGKLLVVPQKLQLEAILRQFAHATHSSQNLASQCPRDCFWNEWKRQQSRFALAEEWMFWSLKAETSERIAKVQAWSPSPNPMLRWAGIAQRAGVERIPTRSIEKLMAVMLGDALQERLAAEYGRVPLSEVKGNPWPWRQIPELSRLEGKSLQAISGVLDGSLSPKEAAGLF